MEFTLSFLQILFNIILLILPLIIFFLSIVFILGQFVGRIEGWSIFNSFYWSFITALTVGYGDIRPVNKISKIISILIALFGLMFTGIIVAITVYAATETLHTFR